MDSAEGAEVEPVEKGKLGGYKPGQNPNTKATQFKSGEANPSRRKKPVLLKELTDTLTAMRHVISGAEDVTEQQKAMRQWKESAPGAFFQELRKLEEQERQDKEKKRKKDEGESDEGSERCLALLEEFFAERGWNDVRE